MSFFWVIFSLWEIDLTYFGEAFAYKKQVNRVPAYGSLVH
jgi:hypothetical protein